MTPMTLEIRTITIDEAVAFRTAVRFGFATRDTVEDPEWAEAVVDPVDRCRAAFENDRIVATLQSFPTTLTLPGGGTITAGALTAVTCHPTHRRQGVLTRMIGADLAASKERGEPADILIAAEYPIYGRFGYGPAVMSIGWELDAGKPRFATPGAGTVEFVDNETFRKEAPAIFERVRLSRPGMIARSDFDWDVKADIRRRPEDKPWLGFRLLCRDDAGTPQGWANYKIDDKWDGMRPLGKVEVSDLCAATPEAEARLWRFLAELDLIITVTAGDRPVDDILPWLLHDARAAKHTGACRLRLGAAARRAGTADRASLLDERHGSCSRWSTRKDSPTAGTSSTSPRTAPPARPPARRPTSPCPCARSVACHSTGSGRPLSTRPAGSTSTGPALSPWPTRCSPGPSPPGATPGSDGPDDLVTLRSTGDLVTLRCGFATRVTRSYGRPSVTRS